MRAPEAMVYTGKYPQGCNNPASSNEAMPPGTTLRLPSLIHLPFALPITVLILGFKDLNEAQRVKLHPALHGENVVEEDSHSDPCESRFLQPVGSKIFD